MPLAAPRRVPRLSPSRARERDRFFGERARRTKSGSKLQLQRLQREQARTASRIWRGSSSSIARSIAASRSLSTCPITLVVARGCWPGRSCGELSVRQGGGDPGGLEQRLAVGGVARLDAVPRRARSAPHIARGCRRRRELDGVGEQFHRLRGGKAVERPLTCAAGVVGGLGPVDRDRREPPVQRQLREVLPGVLAVELLECVRDALVHPRAASDPQPVIQRLVDQRVSEAKLSRPLLGFAQQRGGDCRLEMVK